MTRSVGERTRTVSAAMYAVWEREESHWVDSVAMVREVCCCN